ncbi:serine hydrolase [Fibrisoma limi]|nr:serine hydrolase [Fibrisoma limi]
MKQIVWLTYFLYCLCQPAYGQTPQFVTDSLDIYIKRGMTDWQIPGMAVGIVENGKIILAKGYGVLEAGTQQFVNENTVFPIASNSKLFTGTGFALLDTQKKLSLDEKVIKYLPNFKLNDPIATQLVTIRDLLSHRLGFKNYQGDFLFWDSSLTRQDVVTRMQLHVPPYQFRQDFGYSNQGYVVASELIPKVTNQTWEQFIQNQLLNPLGMTRTFILYDDMRKQSNVALPYTTCCNAQGNLTRIPYDNLDNLGPATGMSSTVRDMTLWLKMQLDSGRVGNRQIIPWAALEKSREANTIASSSRMTLFPLGFQFYCLGVGLLDYAGVSVFAHAGACSGFRSSTTLVPSKKLGIVILTNQDHHSFQEALRFQLLDAYLGVPYTNRHQYYFNRAKAKDQKSQEEIKALASRVEKNAKPALPLSAYTGTYQNNLYGTLTITAEPVKQTKQRLTIRFQHHPNLTGQLDYMDGNQFRLTFSNPRFGIFPVTFVQDSAQVKSIELSASEFVDNDSYIFSKERL